jgi:hypothetical protein
VFNAIIYKPSLNLVNDVSIGSINCDPNNADRGRSIIRATYIVCNIFRKRMYKLLSSKINTWAFPYWSGYHSKTPILARDAVEGQYESRDDNQANMEMPMY